MAKIKLIAVICLIFCSFGLVGCGKVRVKNYTALGSPEAHSELSNEDKQNEDYLAFKKKVEAFSAAFATSAYAATSKSGNVAISPVSVYMALALSAECASGDTRAEILSALGMSYEEMSSYTSWLFCQLDVVNKLRDTTIGRLSLSNTIWLDESLSYSSNEIERLASEYYCYSNSVDFMGANAKANKAVRSFIKDKTNGLIDEDFNLSDKTVFALINALYLKDIWNDSGRNLSFTSDSYNFLNSDGTQKSKNLLQGYYRLGNVIEGEKYTTFYTATESLYKIKFIVPKEGYSVNEIFTAETVAEVNAITDYNGRDDVNMIEYYTRVLFPEFNADFDGYIGSVLKNSFGISKMFSSSECDFSTLTGSANDGTYCDNIRHVTTLTVDRKGIEGAAVTVEAMNGSTQPPHYTKVYQDFIVDRAFGFILTDYSGTTIFSGVVNKL